MTVITLRLGLASALVVGIVLPGAGSMALAQEQSATYAAASLDIGGGLDPAWLNVFPLRGSGKKLPLRPALVGGFYFLGSSLDGRVLYGLTPAERFGGLKELQISPMEEKAVAGSMGLGNITSLIVTSGPTRILVSGSLLTAGKSECGDFRIDPSAGVLEPLRLGVPPDCGGPVSPDGRRELHLSGDQLSILELLTGKNILIGSGMKWPSWSPDGRWIGVIEHAASAMLIDSTDFSKRRRIARADGPMVWSPDSKYVLFQKSQISCWASLYGVSLEAVNIETGKHAIIRSSHCNVLSGGSFFWIARDVVP